MNTRRRTTWLWGLACSACTLQPNLFVGEDKLEAAVEADAGGRDGAIDAARDTAVPDAPPTDAEATPAADGNTDDAGPPVCVPGHADCDGLADNGCEADLRGDRNHCGGCDVACPTEDCRCDDGVRVVDCAEGHGDCDGRLENGCETDLTADLDHCGACDVACPTSGFEVRDGECVDGACALVCVTSFHADCDGDLGNGCETRTWRDDNNCGACGVQCTCHDGRCL